MIFCNFIFSFKINNSKHFYFQHLSTDYSKQQCSQWFENRITFFGGRSSNFNTTTRGIKICITFSIIHSTNIKFV